MGLNLLPLTCGMAAAGADCFPSRVRETCCRCRCYRSLRPLLPVTRPRTGPRVPALGPCSRAARRGSALPPTAARRGAGTQPVNVREGGGGGGKWRRVEGAHPSPSPCGHTQRRTRRWLTRPGLRLASSLCATCSAATCERWRGCAVSMGAPSTPAHCAPRMLRLLAQPWPPLLRAEQQRKGAMHARTSRAVPRHRCPSSPHLLLQALHLLPLVQLLLVGVLGRCQGRGGGHAQGSNAFAQCGRLLQCAPRCGVWLGEVLERRAGGA